MTTTPPAPKPDATPRYRVVTVDHHDDRAPYGAMEPAANGGWVKLEDYQRDLTAARQRCGELEADAAHVRQANANYREENRLAIERASQAESRLAAAEKDAARYRWLRDYGEDAAIYTIGKHSNIVLAQGEKLDAAIDAAKERGDEG